MSNKGLYGSPNPVGKEDKKQVSYGNLNKNFNLSPADIGKTVRISKPNGFNVVLPDARLLVTAKIVVIANTSLTDFDVLDNASVKLKTIKAGKSAICWCTTITTSAGIWAVTLVGKGDYNQISMGNAFTSLSANAAAHTSVCQLSPTSAVILYCTLGGAYNVLQATVCAMTIVNGVIAYGTPVTPRVDAGNGMGDAYHYSIAKMSDTSAIIVYGGRSYYAPGDYGGSWATMIGVSGLTISNGTPSMFYGADNCNNLSVCTLQTGIAVGTLRHGSAAMCIVFTPSGLNMGFGSPTAIYSNTSNTNSIKKLNGTTAICQYTDVNTYVNIRLITTSGSSIVMGNLLVVTTIALSSSVICRLSDTSFLCAYMDVGLTNIYARIVTVVNGVMTLGSQNTLVANTTALVAAWLEVSSQEETAFSLLYAISNSPRVKYFTVSNNTIVDPSLIVATGDTNPSSLCNLDIDKILVCYQNGSYIKSSIITVA